MQAGGHLAPEFGPNFFQPTLVTDVAVDALVNREETFGPLAAVTKYIISKNRFVEETIQRCIFLITALILSAGFYRDAIFHTIQKFGLYWSAVSL